MTVSKTMPTQRSKNIPVPYVSIQPTLFDVNRIPENVSESSSSHITSFLPRIGGDLSAATMGRQHVLTSTTVT